MPICEEPSLALGYGFLASCTTITEGDSAITAAVATEESEEVASAPFAFFFSRNGTAGLLVKAWKNGGQKFTKVTISKLE